MKHSRTLEAAEALHRQGALEEAAKAYQQILQSEPDQTDACYGLGTVCLQQGQAGHALQLLGKAVRHAPADPQIRYNYALALEATGERLKAVEEARNAAALTRGDARLLLPICQKLLQLNQAPTAFQLLTAYPCQDLEWLALTARAQGECGDWGGALARLDRLTEHQPDQPEAWRQLSRAAAQLRDFEKALAAFETYLSLVQPTGEDLLALADLYLLAHRPEQALATLQRAQAHEADSATLNLLLAKCHRLAGNYAKARASLQRAVRQRPGFGEAWQLLLEQEPEVSMAAFARKSAALADQQLGKPRDQILMRLAAGRALEKCARYQAAFDYFRSANDRHKTLLADQGMRYEPRQTEQIIDRILALFPIGATPQTGTARAGSPIFIVGMPRSGSTLLEKILATFDGVVCAGESEAMEFLAADYYWQMEQGKISEPGDLSGQEWQDLGRRYWQRTRVRGKVITDKMLHNTRHIGLIQGMFPGVPVLYLKRDPRDVCLSIYSRMFPDGHRYACDLEHLAHFCAQTERLMQHWKALYPDRVLEIRYEELIAQPEQQTRSIAAFCALEWHPGCLDFHKDASKSFTFSEMQVRKPLNSEGIGRWKAYEDSLTPLLKALEDYALLGASASPALDSRNP